MTTQKNTRTEYDSMGPMEVPEQAYYGASTMRAVLNFPISNLRLPRSFIRALCLIKQAAAKVNTDLRLLDSSLGKAIEKAAQRTADGELDNHFVVDIFQTGSGTSTNMNANEVIANLGSELLDGKRGSRLIHPNDHVNISQSSNDVIPSALHVAALMGLKEELIPALTTLREALLKKSQEFWPVIKTGRTHLQDATPIRLGQEFLGYAGQIENGLARLGRTQIDLGHIALGGTAVGTGINPTPKFAKLACQLLSKTTGCTVTETSNHFHAQSTLDAVVEASGSLRTIAISLYKIANDIRWMGTGPRAGLGELALPEVQPGSSIMPGKINPVIPESIIQVVAQVVGNDTTIALCGQQSFFELNTALPVAAYNLLQSISLLATSSSNLTNQCILGLRATPKGPEMVEQGLMLATTLAPHIGYDRAADIAKKASKSGATIREVAREHTSFTEDELTATLDPARMTEPNMDDTHSGMG